MSLVETSAGQIEYFVAGSGTPEVLLIHGAGSSARIWGTVQKLMADAGVATVAISLAGAGASVRPTDLTAYQPSSYAQSARAALDALGITRCAVVGHSLGVGNALYLASEHADGLDVRGLILMAGGAGDGRTGPDAALAAKIEADIRATPGQQGQPQDSWTALHTGLDQSTRDALWQDICNNPPERTIGQRIATVKDMTPFLGECDLPTLIVSGDNDSVVPLAATLRMYPKLKPECRHLHVMHGVDHYPNAEVPAEVARVYIQFLRSRL